MLLPCAFGISFKKSLPNAGLQRFISMLTSEVFKTFILRFLIRFELIFYAMTRGVKLHSIINGLSTVFEDYSFSH